MSESEIPKMRSEEELLEAEGLFLEDELEGEYVQPSSPETGTGTGDRVTDQILRFGPVETSGEKSVLLYPVFGWRVAAIRVEYGMLDFLQLASLRLAAAGVGHPSAQHEELGLHRNVIEMVQDALIANGHLNPTDRSPTAEGIKALELQGEVETCEPTYGWMFQDALIGEMVPFLHEGRLNYWSVHSREVQQAKAVFKHPVKAPPAPEPDRLANALRQYHRLRKFERQTAGSRQAPAQHAVFDDEESKVTQDHSGTTQLPERETAIRLVHHWPVRFLVPLQVQLAGSPDGRFDLSCPFGLSDGNRWVRIIQFARASYPDVEAAVASLIESSRSLCQSRLPSQMTPVDQWRWATDQVRAALSVPDTQIDQKTVTWLKRFECEMHRFEVGHDSAFALFTAAGCVLEQTFRWLLAQDPIRAEYIVRRGEHERLARALKDVATALGVKLPEALLTVKPGSVERVFERYNVALKPYLAALMVGATAPNSFHRSVLKLALKEEPAMLEIVCEIGRVRDAEGAHAGEDFGDDAILASEIRKKLYGVVNALC